MATYAKMWTDQWEDEWWVSLKCIERGLYAQMITWAKKSGDTGRILFRNFQDFSMTFGIDFKTSVKIIGKFQEKSKITVCKDNGVLIIEILNYVKNQQLKKATDKKEIGKIPEKSTLNKDKIREDNTEVRFPILRIKELIQMSNFNRALRGTNPDKWIETLLNEYGFDDVQLKIEGLNKRWNLGGLYPPGTPEKARQAILNELEQRKPVDKNEGLIERLAEAPKNV